MGWLRAVAICGALVALPSLASAQSVQTADSGLTGRLRLQGIYAHQTGQPPGDDVAGQVVPELSMLVLGKRSQLRATYTLTASAHTALPADFANRLLLVSTFELSKRTTLLLSAEAGHSTVTNALIARQPSDAPVGILPVSNGQLLTTTVSEGASFEASPAVRIRERIDAAYTKSIDAPLNAATESYNASVIVSIDRLWSRDALGADVRGGYARSHVEPLPTERLVPVAVTPHWRHDYSPTLTSLLAVGAVVVLSPDAGTRPLARPFVNASFNYLLGDATFDLTGSIGTQANVLTAQLLYADQVTFRASTPLSAEHAVVAAATAGYTHGTTIGRREAALRPPDFDAFIADVGIIWSPTQALDLFSRYQFLDQITNMNPPLVSAPAVVRNAVIFGIQLSSRYDPTHVPTRFPQRVDESDARASP